MAFVELQTQCRACVVFCMDYRFHGQFQSFLAAEGLLEDGADIVRVAGVAKNLAESASDVARAFVLDQLHASKRLHGIQQIYLLNHEDCGAYGEELVPDEKEEFDLHRRDLQQARTLLEREFPDTEILTYIMYMNGEARRSGLSRCRPDRDEQEQTPIEE
jgi:hypothetical protein